MYKIMLYVRMFVKQCLFFLYANTVKVQTICSLDLKHGIVYKGGFHWNKLNACSKHIFTVVVK